MQFLFLKDLIVGPVVLAILFLIVTRWRRHYDGTPARQYLLPAFAAKMFSAIVFALVYQFYYGGADTAMYHWGTRTITEAFWVDPLAALELIFKSYTGYSDEAKQLATMSWLYNPPEAMVVRVGGLLAMFTAGSYLGISFIFSAFAFLGTWLIFLTFYERFPALHRGLALGALFVPSVLFWGTSLMKDSLCLGAVGVLVYSLHWFATGRKTKRVLFVLAGLTSAYLLYVVKIYILLALLPAAALWFFVNRLQMVNDHRVRWLGAPILLVLGTLSTIFLVQSLGDGGKYSVDNMLDSAESMQQWHLYISNKIGGSGYELTGSLPQRIPQAIVATLFRPFPWEIEKIINVPASLEGALLLLLTLYVIVHVGLVSFLRVIFSDPNVFFCMAFSIAFSFAVGFTAYNFGALVRYKIHGLPFYVICLVLIYNLASKRGRGVA